MAGGKLQVLRFGDDIWDSSHRFETSWLLAPWTLFAVRALISLYAFAVIFFIIGWEASNQPGYDIHDVNRSFSFFTVLCYWGLAFYFAFAALHTFTYALNGGTPLLNRFPRPLQALHALYFSTITNFPLLVTLVYWSILYSGKFPTTFALWSNVSQHGLNSAFAVFEIIFTRVNPAPWIHLLWLVVLLCCYLGVAYTTLATKHYYVYNFLNPAPKSEGGYGKAGVIGAVFGIAIGICILFGIVRGIVWLRKWVTEKKLNKMGKFYAGRGMEQGEVELEMQRVWEK